MGSDIFIKLLLISHNKTYRNDADCKQSITHNLSPSGMKKLCLTLHVLDQCMSASPERPGILETKTRCAEYSSSRSFENWQGSTDELYEERTLGPNPAVNHGQSQPLKQHLWTLVRQPWARSYLDAVQRACRLLVPNPLGIITECVLTLSLDARLETVTHFHRANSLLQDDKLNQRSFAVFPSGILSSCSEREMFSFTLYRYAVLPFFLSCY